MIKKCYLPNLEALKVRLIFKVHIWFTNVGKLNVVR